VGGRGAGTELIGERALLHLFGEITYRVKNLRSLSECCIPRPTRTMASRCGDTFPFGCFWLKSQTQGLATNPGLHRPSDLSWSLHRPWLLQRFYPTIQCNCSSCPRTTGYRKSKIFRTDLRSGRVSAQATREARTPACYPLSHLLRPERKSCMRDIMKWVHVNYPWAVSSIFHQLYMSYSKNI
jgi:hypothetical protein